MIRQMNGVYRVESRSAIADGIMILMFIGGAMALYAGFLIEHTKAMWITFAVGAALVAAGVLMLTVFKFTKLVAEVSEEGILERASKVSKGVIRWEEIEKVYVYDSGMRDIRGRGMISGENDYFFGIALKDPDAYANKLNFVQKGIMKIALNKGCAPINIPCNMLGEDAEALVEVCNNILKKKQAAN